jgi:radical SAM superfamily enzyme YgiQ (UPF0313 family)
VRVAIIALDPWEGTGSFQPFDFGARRIQASLIAAETPGLQVDFVEARIADLDMAAFESRVLETEPDLVAASAFVWSFPLLVDVIEAIKRRRPATTAIMGGPSARPAMFDLAPYRHRRQLVDALVTGEGEEIIRKIVALPSLSRESLSTLPGLMLSTSAGWTTTGAAPKLDDLDWLPSPYAMGLVPRGLSAHVESFRGCPLACSFCEWGADGDGKRAFSRDYIMRELAAVSALRTGSVAMLTDAALNLNPRAFKNLRDAEREVHVLSRIGLNFEVYPSHLTDAHLEFVAELQEHRTGRAGLGLQSYDPDVLKAMNRPFDEKRFDKVARLLADTGCYVEIETIVGLPGDTPETFRRTMDRARELPADVRVYPCLALPDGLMTRAPEGSSLDFDPYTLLVRSGGGWTEKQIRETWEYLDESADQESLSGDHRVGQRRVAMSWIFRGSVQNTRRHVGHALGSLGNHTLESGGFRPPVTVPLGRSGTR